MDYIPVFHAPQIICPFLDRDKMCTVTDEYYESQKAFAEDEDNNYVLYEIPEEVAIQWKFNVKKVSVQYYLVSSMYTETYECLASPLGFEPRQYSPVGKPPPNLYHNLYGAKELSTGETYEYWATSTTIPDSPEYDHYKWEPPTNDRGAIFLHAGKWYHAGGMRRFYGIESDQLPTPYLTMTTYLWGVATGPLPVSAPIPLYATVTETFF